jgi:hypothetical protein
MLNPRRIFLIEEFRDGKWRPVLKEKWFSDVRAARQRRKHCYMNWGYETRIAEYLGMKADA